VNILLKNLLSLLMLCCASAAFAQGGPALHAQTRNIERLLDMRSNMSFVRHPQKALDMADAMSEPELFVAALVMSTNPEVWLKAMEHAGKPGTFKNFSQLADPQMFADWFYASIDPRFQRALLSRAFDPKKTKRWMDSMNDPQFFMPAIAVMNPATPMQWIKVTADGRMIRSMQNLLDPNNYVDWMRIPEPQSGDGEKPTTKLPLSRAPIQRY
jgi:hypothetical protein